MIEYKKGMLEQIMPSIGSILTTIFKEYNGAYRLIDGENKEPYLKIIFAKIPDTDEIRNIRSRLDLLHFRVKEYRSPTSVQVEIHAIGKPAEDLQMSA
jgi:hypothetical protein